MDKPDPKQSDDPFSAGGGAVDDLTPPTMKYGPGSLPTQAVPGPASTGTQNTSQPTQHVEHAMDPTMVGPSAANPKARAGRSTEAPGIAGRSGLSATVAGHGAATIMGDVPSQDLSGEKLLRDAPRLESSGKICPSLNGIPLLAKLGQGGMGAVYYGIHPRLRSEVAVKVLPFHLAAQDPGMIQRFFREAQIAAKVRSPHLVSVINVNEESGLFFLVMEYVAGITMGQYIKQLAEKGTIGMDEIDAIDVCLAACTGLDAAHQHGIVHRDLKPENIMVPYRSRTQKTFDLKGAKLMDLGLARSEEGNQSLTGVQSAMGTPGYMSPEQALDAKTADKRSDVFGMGATIYALLTGRPPFKGDAVMKVIMATMHEPHEPVTNLRPDLSPAIVELIERCLDKRPENRFADSHQLIRALRNCRKLLAPESVFLEDDRDSNGGDPNLTTARIPRTATPGVNPNLRSTTGQRGAQTIVDGKKKWLLIAGVGAAAMLAIAVAIVIVKKPWEKGPIDDSGGVKKIEQPVVKPISDAEKKFAIEEHNMAVQNVKGYVQANKFEIAEAKLERARKADLDVPQLPELAKQWDDVRKEIATAKARIVFETKQGDFEVNVASGKLNDARALVETLMPADEAQTKIKERLIKDLAAAEQREKDRQELSQLLVDAAKPGGLLQEKLALVERGLAKVPDDKVALERRDELKRQIAQASSQEAVKGLLAGALDDYNRKLYDSAADKIAQIRAIDPENADALKLDADVKPKLNAAALKKQESDNRRAGLAAYTEAAALYEKNEGDNASAKIRAAISYDPKNASYDLLKTQIEILRDDLNNIKNVEQRKNLAMETLGEAEKLIAVVDSPLKERGLEDATAKITEAGKSKLDDATAILSNIENKNLKTKLEELKQQVASVKTRSESLKQQIEARRGMIGEMRRYDKLIDDASTILADNEKEGSLPQINKALEHITAALQIVETGKSVKDGTRAKDLETKLKKKQGEIQAREKKRGDVMAALGTGDEATVIGKFADALKAYKDAEEKVKGLSNNEVAAVAKKIDEANRMIAAMAKVDGFEKEENFDQALASLNEVSKIAGEKAVAAKKAEIDASKKSLDTEISKAYSAAIASMKANKIDEAVAQLDALSKAHKGRTDVASAASGLREVSKTGKDVASNVEKLSSRYISISYKLDANAKTAYTSLKSLNQDTINKIASSGLDSAKLEASKMSKSASDLYRTVDTAIEQVSRNTTGEKDPFKNNGGNNGGGNNNGGGGRRVGGEKEPD